MNRYFLFTAIALLFAACAKESTQAVINEPQPVPLPLNWQDIIRKADGNVQINLFTTLGDKKITEIPLQSVWATAYGFFYDAQRSRTFYQQVAINEIPVPFSAENKLYRGQFPIGEVLGKKVDIHIGNETFDIAVIKPIDIMTNIYHSGSTIGIGDMLQWTPDVGNTAGILMTIISGNGNGQKTSGSRVVLSETGSYTFKASDFDGIAKGKTVNIHLSKVSLKEVITSDNKKVVLAATHTVALLPLTMK